MWYRGGMGEWSWALHRISGVGVLIFLCLHILDTALIVLGPQAYNAVIALYRHPVFKVLEIGLVAAVLFHALNGVRIILFDFWVDLTRFHRHHGRPHRSEIRDKGQGKKKVRGYEGIGCVRARETIRGLRAVVVGLHALLRRGVAVSRAGPPGPDAPHQQHR